MAFITKLPAEIVHQILNSFKHDKATLCQLSLASSFFAPVAQQILLKHLVLSVDISLTGTETPFDQIIKKFDETPHLSAHVQTLVLSSRHKCNESLNSIKRALEILNRVTSLKSLHLKNTLMLPRWDISAPTSGSFLERNPLTRLTKLNLKSPWISWDGLATLLYLPKLEHLSLGYLPPGQLPSTLSECRVKFCRIKTLELGSWRGGPDLPLRTLLELTNGLEVLSLSIETATQLNSRRLTPSGVNEALVPVRNTLKALSIIDLCGEDAIVGSRLDLSEFKKLEKVEVSSALFFVSPTDGRLRDGLYKLLPRSLVELQVRYSRVALYILMAIRVLIFSSAAADQPRWRRCYYRIDA